MAAKKFYLAIIVICGAILFSFLKLPDKQLHVVFCDVGQGDAIIIKYRDLQAVIDGGPAGGGVINCLSENIAPWDREIELLILTHPDADHVTGLIDILERYDVKQIVTNSVIKDSAVYWEWHQQVQVERAEIYSPQAEDQLSLGPIVFQVLWPEIKIGDPRIWEIDRDTPGVSAEVNTPNGSRGERSASSASSEMNILGAALMKEDINETSIVMKVSYGLFDILLTGDIGIDTENRLDFPEVEVLKIPHHGSKYSTSDDLLTESSPEVAVISVGKNNFGHPTQEVLSKLSNLGIMIRRTDEQGEIEIISNGKEWWFED